MMFPLIWWRTSTRKGLHISNEQTESNAQVQFRYYKSNLKSDTVKYCNNFKRSEVVLTSELYVKEWDSEKSRWPIYWQNPPSSSPCKISTFMYLCLYNPVNFPDRNLLFLQFIWLQWEDRCLIICWASECLPLMTFSLIALSGAINRHFDSYMYLVNTYIFLLHSL